MRTCARAGAIAIVEQVRQPRPGFLVSHGDSSPSRVVVVGELDHDPLPLRKPRQPRLKPERIDAGRPLAGGAKVFDRERRPAGGAQIQRRPPRHRQEPSRSAAASRVEQLAILPLRVRHRSATR